MGAVVHLWDRLTNALSGKGTTADRRVYNAYAFIPISPDQAEAWYRSTWLGRKIVDIPPFDMTREWRHWQADSVAIEAIEAEEKRLQLKAKCQRALVLSRLYGGGGLVLGTGDSDPTQELNPERVGKGGLQWIQVYSRYQLSDAGTRRLDPADPWFGFPEYFTINTANGQTLKLHPSRVVAFVGQRSPEGAFLNNASWFWGDPIYQSVKQAVENADGAQDGFADLIAEAKIDILKMPNLSQVAATAEGEQLIGNRMQAASIGKSNYRALLMDAEEDWQQKQISWSGMPEMLLAFMDCVAGAADIPLTRLLGQSPRGLQSTGDGEARDYQAMVKARQNELLAPALDRIDELLIRSALGSRPSDVYYEFANLDDTSEADQAKIENQYAQSFLWLSQTGEFPAGVLGKAMANRMVESGRYPGLEAAIEEASTDFGEPDSNDPNNDPSALTEPPPQPSPPPKRGRGQGTKP